MSNIIEESMFPEGMTKEEIAKLSDEQIIKMIIAEKRRRIEWQESNRRASIRRRSKR